MYLEGELVNNKNECSIVICSEGNKRNREPEIC